MQGAFVDAVLLSHFL